MRGWEVVRVAAAGRGRDDQALTAAALEWRCVSVVLFCRVRCCVGRSQGGGPVLSRPPHRARHVVFCVKVCSLFGVSLVRGGCTVCILWPRSTSLAADAPHRPCAALPWVLCNAVHPSTAFPRSAAPPAPSARAQTFKTGVSRSPCLRHARASSLAARGVTSHPAARRPRPVGPRGSRCVGGDGGWRPRSRFLLPSAPCSLCPALG